jgi:small multidrug resistance pump
MRDEFRWYRQWFYAAAAYNVLWGAAVVLFPQPLLDIAAIADARATPLVQVIGMMVGVYAYGYYLLARAPQRYAGLIWIALAGKSLGPLGFLYSLATGALPWSFGWVCVFNDIIWWPAFWSFALKHARHSVVRSP